MANISISFSKRSGKDKQESQEFSETEVDKDEREYRSPSGDKEAKKRREIR
jgi:hypothetical protein